MCTRYGKSGAHNTVDAQRYVGGALPYGREVAEYCFCRCIGYSPWYHGLTCVPCLAFSIRSLVFSERASSVSWSQSALVVPVGEEQ